MNQYYYRDKAGVEIGPLTLDALAKLRFAGVLNGDTPVRAADSTEWKPCRETIADLPQVDSPATPVSVSDVTVSSKSGVWQHGWSLFALAVLCFLLPFIDVSCQGTKVTLTGQQLVAGTDLQQNDAWTGQKKTKRINPYPAAQCALGSGVAAFLLSLGRKRTTSLLSGLAGAGGVVSLFVLKSTFESEIAAQGQGLVTLNIREGFWLAGVLLVGGAITQFKFFNEAPATVSTMQWKDWRVPKRYQVALVVLAIGLGVTYGGVVLYKSLSDKATLSFDLSLDGKPLPVVARPNVQVDGKPLRAARGASGCSATTLGRHKLSVQLENAEPLERSFWVFCGNMNLGTLPLESSKGSLLVTVNPIPATVILKHAGEVVRQGDAPLQVDKLPVGDYTLAIHRGEYEETRSIKVEREQRTEAKVELNLGSADLSSDPPDAEFELRGNGRSWQGKLPTRIDDAPVGDYSLVTSRKGWVLTSDISISRGGITTNKTEFRYGSLEVTSDPTGMTVSTNGVEIGKTPTNLRELRPGRYTLTATDGENDLMADIAVAPKEASKHAFSFRYGFVQLASTPAGATVTRKGKAVGTTPLTLERIPTGETAVELQLAGYVSTNLALVTVEGMTNSLSVKLISEQYLQSMQQAREALYASRFADAKSSVGRALDSAPGDAAAIRLGDEISQAERNTEEARRQSERSEVVNVIEKAIHAVGGREPINRFRSFKAVYNTSGKRNGVDYTHHITVYMQLPDKLRLDEDISNQPKTLNILGHSVGSVSVNQGKPFHNVACVTGFGSWEVVETLMGVVHQPVPQITEDNFRKSLHLAECTSFVPLLGLDFRLQKLPDGPTVPDGTIAIRVRKANMDDVTLVFDKDSGFLQRLDTEDKDDNGHTAHGSTRYMERHSFSGYICPRVSIYSTDGGTSITTEMESLESLNPYYGDVFSEPPRQ